MLNKSLIAVALLFSVANITNAKSTTCSSYYNNDCCFKNDTDILDNQEYSNDEEVDLDFIIEEDTTNDSQETSYQMLNESEMQQFTENLSTDEKLTIQEFLDLVIQSINQSNQDARAIAFEEMLNNYDLKPFISVNVLLYKKIQDNLPNADTEVEALPSL